MSTTIPPPASSPSEVNKFSSIPTISPIPSLTTSPASRRSNIQRPSSFAKNRLSTYSSTSFTSQNCSRPASHAFPIFHSSLPYALVRDFAYPPIHPLHYGSPSIESGISSPVSEARRLSDPAGPSWDGARSHWPSTSWNPDTMYSNQQLPAMTFGDGPPYSEDEDLHSPVVTTTRHRKHKSAYAGSEYHRGRSPAANNGDSSYSAQGDERGILVGVNGDGSTTYYVKDHDAVEDGPGGEYVIYPARESVGGPSYLSPNSHRQLGRRRDSHFAASFQGRQTLEPDMELQSDDDISEDDEAWRDSSRYSRDYQFTIVSPDEEMHGKAVALFDFDREHENELPLKEGQVILVSYRHGQGWLVAEDPKTGESGLVPEEFVRLVRDIEGGLNGLNGALSGSLTVGGENPSPDSESTPTQCENHNELPARDTSSDQSAQQQQSNGNTPNDTDENTNTPPPTTTTTTTNNNNNNSNHHQFKCTASPSNINTKGKPQQDAENNRNGNHKDHTREKKQNPAILSTFSTSSRDLDPYPLAGHQHRKSTPPQIEHYDGGGIGNGTGTGTGAGNLSLMPSGIWESSVCPNSLPNNKQRTRSGEGKAGEVTK
ncbi:hypothetical protein PABG_06362 [Paracoccidioides brasiliensis Pb03]|nr:hypothetical protein PABG_06362 [Paracoccidioides brasiliensis Pb03]